MLKNCLGATAGLPFVRIIIEMPGHENVGNWKHPAHARLPFPSLFCTADMKNWVVSLFLVTTLNLEVLLVMLIFK